MSDICIRLVQPWKLPPDFFSRYGNLLPQCIHAQTVSHGISSENQFHLSSPVLSEFKFFSRLPFELRREIWRIADADTAPRVLNVGFGPWFTSCRLTAGPYYISRPDPSYIPPSLFLVCREAREVAMKSHIRCYLPLPPVEYFYLNPYKDLFMRFQYGALHPVTSVIWTLSSPDAVKEDGYMVLDARWSRSSDMPNRRKKGLASIFSRKSPFTTLLLSHDECNDCDGCMAEFLFAAPNLLPCFGQVAPERSRAPATLLAQSI